MKFTDGCWKMKSGYNAYYAAQVYEMSKDSNSVSVIATTRLVVHRGRTIDGPIFRIRYSSNLEDVIKVTIEHYTGGLNDNPSFEIHEDGDFLPIIKENETNVELISGKTRVCIPKPTQKLGMEHFYSGSLWDVKYFYGDKLLTSQGGRSTAYITEEPWKTKERMSADENNYFFAHDSSNANSYFRETHNIGVGEYFYGFGEKFTTFVKNGQTVETWNSDGGTGSEQSYKSIPFYVSSKGYGILVNHPEKVSFEVASETVSKMSFSVQGEKLEYFVIGGETISDVVCTYTNLTGRPSLPPAETFGLWLTTSFTTDYDEKTVTSFIDGMAERDIPLEVFHFDCFWMKAYNWCDFTWDKSMFSDPKAMLSRIKAKGHKICVWINPYIAQQSSLFDEGKEKGYFIKNTDGSVWQCDMWQPGLAIVDFTNPEAKNWYQDKLRTLCDTGVDYFKTDFGERIPTLNVKYFDGSDPYKMHNYYAYLYNQTVFEVLEEYYGKEKACLFARSATVGGQKFPVHWGGDSLSTYESMAETLRGGLSLCMSGFGYFSHDISGFTAKATPDLYKRWTAFGLMSSHSRLHGSDSYRVPWNFDDESSLVLRHFTYLKGKLMPYIWAMAQKNAKTGLPLMRAMVMDFGNDPACLTLDRQYMFGDNLLVAPIFNEEGVAEYYVPQGRWTDIQSGKIFEGGKWYRTTHDYFSLPLLAKPNSIIAYGNFEKSFSYDYAENAELVIYALEDGKSAKTTIYDTDGNEVLNVVATRSGDVIYVKSHGKTENFMVKSSDGLEIVRE